MNIEKCTCGSEPLVEPAMAGARNWDVCCLECGARSAMFPNRTEAIMSWNQIVQDNSSEDVDGASVSLVKQLLHRLKRRTSSAES